MLKLEELLKLLGIDKLDEADQTAVQEKLNVVLETSINEKVDEKVGSLIESEKEKLVEDYEVKFEEFKDNLTAKFSNFVDEILESEMVIPDEFLEAARIGKTYGPLVEQIKLHVAVDAGVIDEEAKALLREAKEKLLEQKDEINELTEQKLELELDAQKLAAAVYIREKCDGLTENQKLRVISILEGAFDKEEIDRKFDIVVETLNVTDGKEDEELEEGKGSEEVEDNKRKEINEDDNPFRQNMKTWLRKLNEGN